MPTTHSRRAWQGKVEKADAGWFTGRANQYGIVDHGNEMVRFGAARKTIAEQKGKLPVMVRHFAGGGDIGDACALVVNMKERRDGIWIKAEFLPDSASQKIRQKVTDILKAGGRVSLSIGYRLLKWHSERIEGKQVRVISELALVEITLTLRPMNEGSYVSGVKAKKVSASKQTAMRAKIRTEVCRARVETEVEEKMKSDKVAAARRFVAAKARVYSKVRDPEAEDREACKSFASLVSGTKVQGRRRDLLTPRSERFRSQRDAVRLPDSVTAKVLGRGWAEAWGKALFSFNDNVLNPSLSDYLIPDMRLGPLAKSPLTAPALHEICTTIPTNGVHSLNIPGIVSSDNKERPVSLRWRVDELGISKQETEATFTSLGIPTYELSGYTECSTRGLKRSPSLLDVIAILIKEELGIELAAKILNGSGDGEILGIVNAAGVRPVARQAAGTVTNQDLVEVKHAVKPSARRGAKWLLNDDIVKSFEDERDTTNARPAGFTFDTDRSNLLGIPFRAEDDSPAMGQTGDVIIGNPRFFYLALEAELVLKKSTEFLFSTNRSAFAFAVGIGGRPIMPRAFAMLTERTGS